MKALFSAAAVLTLLLGLAWLLIPAVMLESWGVGGDAVTLYVARRYGALFFGYCTILWFAREAPASPARTAILAGGLVVSTLMAVVSAVGVLTGTVGPLVWSAAAVEVLLAAGFGYQLLRAS